VPVFRDPTFRVSGNGLLAFDVRRPRGRR
jgi:hypothetical protein